MFTKIKITIVLLLSLIVIPQRSKYGREATAVKNQRTRLQFLVITALVVSKTNLPMINQWRGHDPGVGVECCLVPELPPYN